MRNIKPHPPTGTNSLGEGAIANLDQVIVHGLETGGWVTDSHLYLLTGSEPGVTVREYLG